MGFSRIFLMTSASWSTPLPMYRRRSPCTLRRSASTGNRRLPKVTFASVAEPDSVEVLSAAVAFPDVDSARRQDLAVRATRHEPQQLLYHATQEHPFRRQQRERAIGEGEPERRRSKERERARPCPVGP